MDLAPYIESLRQSLLGRAAPGGKEVTEAAELLADSLEPSARLCLLEALADASDEITAALESTSVEVRLRGRDAEFVVSEFSHSAAVDAPGEAQAPVDEDVSQEIARISLRLPESLKDSVDRAAAAESVSVNSWLVRAISEAVDGGRVSGIARGRSRFGRRFTGYGRA